VLAAKAVGAMVIAVNMRFHEREVRDILERSEARHTSGDSERVQRGELRRMAARAPGYSD